MQSKESADIIDRFFLAIETMKRDRVIGGLTPFCNRYSIDRRNLCKLKTDRSHNCFQTGWLLFLVRDFGINADWLITGMGDFYREKPHKNRSSRKTL